MNLSPKALQEQLNAVSQELFERSQEAAEIAAHTGVAWLELRKQCKTNAEADHLFAASKDGSRMAYLKYYIKGLQAKRGALLQEVKANAGNSW